MRIPPPLARWLLVILLLALGLSPDRAQAQPTCIRAYDALTRQQVTYFCVGRQYLVRNNPACHVQAGTDIYYDLDIRDGLQISTAADTITSVVYTVPGQTRITRLVNQAGSDTVSRGFTIFPTTAPRVQITQCLRSADVTFSDTTYDRYTVTFNGAPNPSLYPAGSTVSSPALPGSAAGSIRIVVMGQSFVAGTTLGCPSAAFDTTIQLPARPAAPRMRLLDVAAPTSARLVRLRFDRLVPGQAYVLERAPVPGAFTVVGNTFRPTTDTASLTDQPPSVAVMWRYQLRLLNGECDAPVDPPLASNEMVAMPLSVTAANRRNVVTIRSWPSAAVPAPIRYEQYRDGRRTLQAFGQHGTKTDENVTCQQVYCYQVANLFIQGADTLRAFSADSCVRTISTTPPARPIKFRASFDLGNNLVLTALPPASEVPARFNFFREGRPPTGTPDSIGTSATPELVIPRPDTALVGQQCFSATLVDACELESVNSPTGCPMILRVRRTPDRKFARLSWTPYLGFPSPRYTLQLLDDQTNAIVFETTFLGPVTSYEDALAGNTRQVRRYRVRAEFPVDTPFSVSYSNVADLVDEMIVRLPNAFTPNGDGLNDTFGPVGRYELREAEMTIYDRWGRLVFQTRLPNQPWDGRAPNGDIVPPGVFVFQFRGRDAAGREFNQRGTVTVLR